jgi:hypothetical protein
LVKVDESAASILNSAAASLSFSPSIHLYTSGCQPSPSWFLVLIVWVLKRFGNRRRGFSPSGCMQPKAPQPKTDDFRFIFFNA